MWPKKKDQKTVSQSETSNCRYQGLGGKSGGLLGFMFQNKELDRDAGINTEAETIC